MEQETIIIYNTTPPEPWGNLKALCDNLEVSYHSYKMKKFPFEIKGVMVYKEKVNRGKRKTN